MAGEHLPGPSTASCLISPRVTLLCVALAIHGVPPSCSGSTPRWSRGSHHTPGGNFLVPRVTGSCSKREPVTFSDMSFTVVGCCLSYRSVAVRRHHGQGNLQMKHLIERLLRISEGQSVAGAQWQQACMVLEQ